MAGRPAPHIPIGASGDYAGQGGATSLTDLTDVTGTPAPGYGPVADQTAVEFPLTRVVTQADLDAILTSVAAVDWHDIALQNGFTNYEGYAPARYRLTLNNVVFVEGIVNADRQLGDGDVGLVLAQLPPECSPGLRLIFNAPTDGTQPARLDVQADGTISFEGFFGGGGSPSQRFSLCQINYSVGGASPVVLTAVQEVFG